MYIDIMPRERCSYPTKAHKCAENPHFDWHRPEIRRRHRDDKTGKWVLIIGKDRDEGILINCCPYCGEKLYSPQ